jgi:3-hydroxybutyrate dehydrogenase
MSSKTATTRFDGRAALVTGAASGIGREIACALATAGAEVAFADVDSAGAEAAAATCGGSAYGLGVDVGNPSECRHAVAEVERRSGRLDLLVNNAGVQHVAPTHEFPDDQWDRLIAIMLSGAFHLIKASLPGMYERRFGRILNITSMLGLYGAPFKPAYTAAKHGIHGLMKVVALEGAVHNVTCNALSPAYVRTPLVERQIADQARAHKIPEAEVVERIMLAEPAIKRLLEPGEVARVSLFLLSEDAAFMTGSELRLDGGYSAR